MTLPSLVWGDPRWMTAAAALMAAAALSTLWSYTRSGASGGVRAAGFLLKTLGFAALAVSLLDPLLAGTRPKRGANAFAVLADNSQSLLIRDAGSGRTRGDAVRDSLRSGSPWRTRLGQDFDVRSYLFDANLRAVDGFDAMAFDGTATSLNGSLSALARRFRGLPLAGVLLFTDGNRTDLGDVDWSALPPVYPVAISARGVAKDVGIVDVSVSQTNFESAPVVVRADVKAVGLRGQPIVAVVVDEADQELERRSLPANSDDATLSYRFQFRPPGKGVTFYRVRAFAAADEANVNGKDAVAGASGEQTLANNARLVVVDQGGGPYRVLYASGRPGWEFKFLNRAVADDSQVELIGLIRIARRQPKFDFRNPRSGDSSALFKGFDNADPDSVEAKDQPVLIRLGTDEVELRDGFPKTAEALYAYHAIILDDLEAAFFTQDQLTLIRNFVGVRGGGLLMLGGPDSFADGKYDRTPVGEILPVYLDRALVGGDPPNPAEYRLALTREGWLQPWVRTRKTEDDERIRLEGMSGFRALSRAASIKPGAAVLAQVVDLAGQSSPALVAQQFGKGHVAALLIGDLWRSALRRADPADDDLGKSWRQTVRWLVGDVPGRVEVAVRPSAEAPAPAVTISVRVRDAEYRPLDDAKVSLKVALPGGDPLTLDAEPDGREAGSYAATYVAKAPGAYRVVAAAAAPDGSPVASREAGWAAQPAADEFARLEPDRAYLDTIAAKTGGAVVDPARLDAFVSGLSARSAPITEPWTMPLWHTPLFFTVALACFAGEWGLRRVNGLA